MDALPISNIADLGEIAGVLVADLSMPKIEGGFSGTGGGLSSPSSSGITDLMLFASCVSVVTGIGVLSTINGCGDFGVAGAGPYFAAKLVFFSDLLEILWVGTDAGRGGEEPGEESSVSSPPFGEPHRDPSLVLLLLSDFVVADPFGDFVMILEALLFAFTEGIRTIDA